MDSRLIHEASQKLLKKVKWTLPSDKTNSEWIYFGLGKELNQELINQLIDQTFSSTILFLDINRTDSLQINKTDLKSTLEKFIGIYHFILWDNKFQNIIQFNKSGILRHGQVNNTVAT